jgi:hypothetical protein
MKKVRSSILLILGLVFLTNGISIRLVSDRLKHALFEIADQKRQSLIATNSADMSEEGRTTAIQAVFEVEKRIALSRDHENLTGVANILIFAGVLFCGGGIYASRRQPKASHEPPS